MLDGTTQSGGAPGQSMKAEAGVGGAPGQSMKAEDGGAVGGPGQSMKHEAGGPGAPGQSMKGDSGGPGQPGQSVVDAGASGGPGQPTAAKDAAAGSSGGPESAKAAKAEAELKAGEPGKKKDDPQLKAGEPSRKAEVEAGSSGGPGAPKEEAGGPGASGGPKAGGPGAKKADEDDELVDPDADRPNFGAAGVNGDEAEDEDEEDDNASAGATARGGAKGGKAAKKKTERKPIDPAYVTVATMALAIVTLAGMIWLGRGILMEMWPGISGFYKSVGMEAAKPGDGLKIAESSKRLQRIGGVETLVVRGFISNISELPKTVPNLRLELYNERKEAIQDSSAPPPAGVLDPGASVEFDIRMELPQLSAAKGGYAVVWEE